MSDERKGPTTMTLVLRLHNIAVLMWREYENGNVDIGEYLQAVAKLADELAHPYGAPGVLPPGVSIDGGTVWFLMPGRREWEPATLEAIDALEWEPAALEAIGALECDERKAAVTSWVHGTTEPGHDLTREQQAAAIYRERWVLKVPA